MKRVFVVEVYELHVQDYEVELDENGTEEDAVQAYLAGEATLKEDAIWYHGQADRYHREGMPEGIRSVELTEEYED
jgi:hypothetical protein